jgi:hypothetical protein
MYKKYNDFLQLAKSLQEIVNEKFSDEVLFQGFCDSIYKPDPEYLEWLKELEELDED